MSVMATTTTTTAKMKPSAAAEFLSGEGADLCSQKKRISVNSVQEQDDLDLFLSEITVQFDDEVQTLYVGPVEIVDDDDDDSNDGAVYNKRAETDGQTPLKAEIASKEDRLIEPEQYPTTVAPLEKNKIEEYDKIEPDNENALATTKTSTPDSDCATKGTKTEGNRAQQISQLPFSSMTTATLKVMTTLQPLLPSQPASDDTVTAAITGGGEPPKEVVDSANDDRLHHLTAAAVVIDPKKGKDLQTVSNEDLNKPAEPTAEISQLKCLPATATEVATSLPGDIVTPVPRTATKPTAIISPTSKRRNIQQPHLPIKREAKQPSSVAETVVSEQSHSAEKLEEEPRSTSNEQLTEQEEESPEEELIIPDVLAAGAYEKDSSPAGSDSGIENEGTEINKVVAQEGEESNETVKYIPREFVVDKSNADQGDSIPKENTRVKVLDEVVIEGGNGKFIKCALCAMRFRKEQWYKNHLMNYHGIDLSNIAHFLSNLQTLDEGIQDGDGTMEQEFEEFQLQQEDQAPGSNNDATDKTDFERYSSKRKSEDIPTESTKKVCRQESTSTPSPSTLQMYPEVQLSTSNKKPTAGRRRKEKLVLINSDADMKINHEIGSTNVNSEESTSSSSQTSQPLMFVVKYLEQAAMLAGSSGKSVDAEGMKVEHSKTNLKKDPLSLDELEDGMTPFERSKIVELIDGNESTFTCSICETVFQDRQTIQDHVNIIHKDVRRRSCPHCGRTFTQTGDLTRHVRIHTGIRPFKCPIDGCEYAFISSGDLHKHVRRHNQLTNPIPKPHVCDKCGKDFERGYDLKRHSSMHAKDDPNFKGFICELCGKMFARKDQYRAHTYRHIGYKPHKCNLCEKTFSDASNYAKHVKVHGTDGMQLFCDHCNKGFKNKMAISKHVFFCKYKSSKRKTSTGKKKQIAVMKKESEPQVGKKAA